MPCVRLGIKHPFLGARAARRAKKHTRDLNPPAQVGVMADDATLVVFQPSESLDASGAPRVLQDGDTVNLRPERQSALDSNLPVNLETVADGSLVPSLGQAMARLERLESEPRSEEVSSEFEDNIVSFSLEPLSSSPTLSDKINAESRLGSLVFGPVPEGHQREFFHDRDNVWIWYESWEDEEGVTHEQTVRYEVRPSGVFKKLAAGQYSQIQGGELENFRRATHTYLALIKRHLYHLA